RAHRVRALRGWTIFQPTWPELLVRSIGGDCMQPRAGHKPLYAHLYIQVLIAIAIGVLCGVLFPAEATLLKPLGDGFIKLIKMMIAPIIFTTVVVGIAKMGDMKEVGRVGLKALDRKSTR